MEEHDQTVNQIFACRRDTQTMYLSDLEVGGPVKYKT